VASEHLKARKKCLQYGYLLFKLNPEAFAWRHYFVLAFVSLSSAPAKVPYKGKVAKVII
jgi:hypothetical protein